MSFSFQVSGFRFHVLRVACCVSDLRFAVRGPRFPVHWLESKVQSPKSKALRNTQRGTRNLPLCSSSKGFTLLEVLVASSILSIVLAILYGVFSQTLTSKQRAEERVALSRTARIVLLRMGEDLQGSFPFAPDDARFVGKTYRTSSFAQASLSFMSFANAQVTSTGREGDWSTIAYDLLPDPLSPSLYQLVRRVRLSSDSFGSSYANEQKGEVLPLLSRVQGLQVRFFDGRVWLDEWGGDRTKGQVPQAVEVELRLALVEKHGRRNVSQEESALFSTVIDLPLASPLGNATRLGGSS